MSGRPGKRAVIADAGPLIALAGVHALHLLTQLFGEVFLTQTVWNEIFPQKAAFDDTPYLHAALQHPEFCIVETGAPTVSFPTLDPGEASVIGLALIWRDQGVETLLVMDDLAARREAQQAGLSVIGVVGVIVLAKENGLIASARALLEQVSQHGYFIGARIINAALRQMGE
jgi:predicted nucleic acid-binding protein